mmetsp:Transcript_28170/g.93558  ORF Transcript_28170/g.93558 Transcript_28170/m.93558 type:complete len:207 (-) Transcript_28170:3382-4002(-)
MEATAASSASSTAAEAAKAAGAPTVMSRKPVMVKTGGSVVVVVVVLVVVVLVVEEIDVDVVVFVVTEVELELVVVEVVVDQVVVDVPIDVDVDMDDELVVVEVRLVVVDVIEVDVLVVCKWQAGIVPVSDSEVPQVSVAGGSPAKNSAHCTVQVWPVVLPVQSCENITPVGKPVVHVFAVQTGESPVSAISLAAVTAHIHCFAVPL